MDQILNTPVEDKHQKLVYAGFWIRAAAIVIDSILMLIFWFLALVVLVLAMGDSFFGSEERIALFYLGGFVINYFYFAVLESSDKQATLGKMAVGIKVGDEKGNKISFGRATGRFFSKFLSGLMLYIGFMMAGWDRQKQSLHDNIADTYVFYA